MNQNLLSRQNPNTGYPKWKSLMVLLVFLCANPFANANVEPSLNSYQFTINNPGLSSDIQHGASQGVLTICSGTVVDIFGDYNYPSGLTPTPTMQLIQWVGTGPIVMPDIGNTGGVGDPWQYIGSPSVNVATESITFTTAGMYHYSVVGFHPSDTLFPGNYYLDIEVEAPVTGSAALTINNTFCTGGTNELWVDGPSGYNSTVTITDEYGDDESFNVYFGSGPVNLLVPPYGANISQNQNYTIQHSMSNSCGGVSWTGSFSTYGPVVEASDLTICPGVLSPAIVATTAAGSIPADTYTLYDDTYSQITSNNSGVFALNLQPGEYTYYVSGESVDGCVSENYEEVSVTVHYPMPTYTYNDISYCLPSGGPSLISYNVSGPSSATYFTLYINGVAHSSSTTGNFFVTEANFDYGINNCQVVITSPCETVTSNFTVTEGNIPQFFANNVDICLEDISSAGIDINLASASSFSGYINYDIYGPGGYAANDGGNNMFTLNIPLSVFTANGSGTYTIYVSAVDDFGCRTDKNLKVTIKVNDCPCDVRTNFNANYYPNDPNRRCAVRFTPLIVLGSDMAMISQFWDYGDGTTATNPPNPNIHDYGVLPSATVFNVCYTVTAKHIPSGRICKVTICLQVSVD